MAEKKISQGRLFSVMTTVDDSKMKALKRAPELVQATMEAAAFHWHTGILPDHFTRAAHGKYGYAERAFQTLRQKGANPDLVKTGAMKAQLLAKASAKKKGAGVELKLTARALNFVPNTGNPFDVRIKRGSGAYPNMKREIREVTDQEQTELANMISTNLAAALSGSDDGSKMKLGQNGEIVGDFTK